MVAADPAGTPESLIVSVLSALIASVIGVAGLWFQEWHARRGAEARRRRELDEARAYLGFLAEWFSTHAVIAPDSNIASTRTWAAEVLSRQLRDLHTEFTVTPQRERTRFWVLFRKLLLLYPVRSITGSLVRLFFYVIVIIVFSLTPGLLVDKHTAWGDRIGASLLLIVTGAGLLYGLWRLVARLSPNAESPGGGEERIE